MNNGIITIKLEGISLKETERCRAIIHELFEMGIFNVRNGKAILNFDHEGSLAEVEIQVKRWRRDKPMPELKFLEQFKVSSTPDNSTVAERS